MFCIFCWLLFSIAAWYFAISFLLLKCSQSNYVLGWFFGFWWVFFVCICVFCLVWFLFWFRGFCLFFVIFFFCCCLSVCLPVNLFPWILSLTHLPVICMLLACNAQFCNTSELLPRASLLLAGIIFHRNYGHFILSRNQGTESTEKQHYKQRNTLLLD